jgi:chromosome condensin MukBEF ATPase and DNA-binding subunit MukB
VSVRIACSDVAHDAAVEEWNEFMSIDRDIGALEARMELLENEVHVIRKDVREIRDALVTARGGWRMLTLVIGVSASAGALIGKLIPVLTLPKP